MPTLCRKNTASCLRSWATCLKKNVRRCWIVAGIDDPAWRANQVLTIDIDYNYERSIENGIDPAHNEFVHPTHGFTAFNRETYHVRDYETEDHSAGLGLLVHASL